MLPLVTLLVLQFVSWFPWFLSVCLMKIHCLWKKYLQLLIMSLQMELRMNSNPLLFHQSYWNHLHLMRSCSFRYVGIWDFHIKFKLCVEILIFFLNLGFGSTCKWWPAVMVSGHDRNDPHVRHRITGKCFDDVPFHIFQSKVQNMSFEVN